MSKLMNLAKKVSEILAKNLKEVKAVVIIGSLAKGFADKYSDVDLIAYVDKIPNQTKREKLWKSLNIERAKHVMVCVDILKINKEEVNITYKKIDEISWKI